MKTSLNLIVYLISGNVFLFSVEGAKEAAKDKCHNTPVNRTGHPGGSIAINCSYPRTERNLVKQFYKDVENQRLKIIESQSPKTTLLRFTLTDAKERGVYTVGISELTHKDAGKYVCGLISDTGMKCLTEIHLRILSWDDIKPRNVSYVTSQRIYINCSYTDKYKENEKFLCKGVNPTNCVKLINTTYDAKDKLESRFQIRDNPRSKYFYVYITNATKSDSGTYWCGFGETLQHDSYTKIQLSVAGKKEPGGPGGEEHEAEAEAEADDDDDDDDDNDNDEDDDHMKAFSTFRLSRTVLTKICSSFMTHSLLSATNGEDTFCLAVLLFGILGCLLVTVAVVALMLCRQRLTCTREGNTSPGRNSQRENEEHNYEEIHFEIQPASSRPSVNATVNAPADQLLYSVVSFDLKGTDQADRPPAPVPTIYSTARNPEEQ